MASYSQLLSPEGLRVDGRRDEELRRIRVDLGHLQRMADGSCLLEQGLTRVLAAVHGPREGEAATILVHLNNVQGLADKPRRRTPRHDRRLLEMALLVKQSLEHCVHRHLYPRSEIRIDIQILQSDGSALAVALNAACLALMDAGVAMDDYVLGCSAGLVDDTPILDLCQLEEKSGANIPKFTLAVQPRTGRVVMVHLESRMHLKKFQAVQDLALSGALRLHPILESFAKSFATLTLTSDVPNRTPITE